jgi:quercetin dioxygenase-like cupin family protein
VITKVTALVASALTIAACSAAATVGANPDALASGASVTTLDAGELNSLPTGPVYIRVIRFEQQPGYVIHSKSHVASVVYVETGVHRLILDGQAPIDLMGGQAKFHQSVAHTHLNPGPGPSVWYSIALWPSSARGQAPVDKIARAAFESDDIARDALPQVAYSQVLRQVTLANLGTTGAHRFGGLAAFYVLKGTVTIRSAHRPTVTLGVGQGTAFVPGVALQEANAGPGQALFLEFLTTAVGQDFEVRLGQPPPA